MPSGSPGLQFANFTDIPITSSLSVQDMCTFAIQIDPKPATSLYDVLANSLISSRIVTQIPLTSLLAIASTNHQYRNLITREPRLSSSFQYLNLAPVKRAALDSNADINSSHWGNQRMDEGVTEDEFYSSPLRSIFNRMEKKDWLFNISTLMLDGLTVPTEIVREIIMEDRFNVRILSIRGVKQLNHQRLCQTLKYSVRPTRPEGTPKLRGLYIFGPEDPKPVKEETTNWPRRRSPTSFPETRVSDTVKAVGARLSAEWNRRSQATLAKELTDNDDKWYHSGKMIARAPHAQWAETIMACEGIIHFDAVLCRGPRHSPPKEPNADTSNYLQPAVATVSLGPTSCSSCKSCPEGPAVFGQSPSYQLPLLAPPPFNTVSIRAAQMPSSSYMYLEPNPRVIARCLDCIRERWCERCHKWWCESCYDIPAQRHTASENALADPPVHTPPQMGARRDCFGCGQTCHDCKDLYMRACTKCNNEYCIIDNDGSSIERCDWCNYSGRRTYELH
ncbi:hypothetical protein BT63DRAFT_63260 [Microthyrium microscopicum]|uniref:Uncharacterized protein n=1 Tax=Microthyrium microscopicum TaxID=703497 RepID=A0A6A6TZ70_9PEZI|nr:hypothetical protein BT63DRAFT_63260 [Microthyrium microscopicum]